MIARAKSDELHLLLVEDNPGDADLVREMLSEIRSPRISLEAAASLAEAREAAAGSRFDAILLDLHLPDSQGLETLHAMHRATPATPIVVLSGLATEEMGDVAVGNAAADFLPKDEITAPLLSRSIRYAVQRRERYELEARFRGLIERSRDLVAILDPDFTIQYITPSVTPLLGFSQEEKMGRDAREAHPDDAEIVEAEVRKLLDGREDSVRIEHRVRHKDGSRRIFDTFIEDRRDDPAIGGLLLTSWDITELREREEELRSARERIAILQRVSEIANQARRVEGALEIMARELPQLLGWDVGHAIRVRDGTLRSLSYHHPEASTRAREFEQASERMEFGEEEAFVSRAVETGEIQVMEDLPSNPQFLRRGAVGPLRKGVAIPVLARGKTAAVLELFCTGDEPVGPAFRGLLKDIMIQLGRVAEREQAERKIQESEALLRQLVDGVPDALFVKDRSGRYTLINEAGAEMVGRTPEEVIGATDRELFEPQHAESVIQTDRRAMERGEQFHTEERIRDVRGAERVLLTTKGPLQDATGNVVGTFGIARDISPLKETQQALNERVKELRCLYRGSRLLGQDELLVEERLRRLVDVIPPGWLHPEVTEARITYGDSTFETGGFDETEWRLAEPVAARGRAIGRIEVGLREERPGPSGSPFLPEEEELLKALALAVERALERDRLKTEFALAQKMEAVGRLSAGVAHDFNNILTVIRSHADFVLMEDGLGDPVREELKEIQSAADKAAALTKQLLAFGRKQFLRARPIDANRSVEETVRLAGRTLGEDIVIEMELGDDLPAIEVDPTHLEQALLNLAVNARDAMPGGGRLTLGTTVEEVTGAESTSRGIPAGRYVRLTVSDTGTGMDEETRSRIFEPFYSTKTDRGGTGLGLAMVHGITHQSGGAIHVESVLGQGTTFVLRFPAVDAVAESPEPSETRGEEGAVGTGRVLVVEDDDAVRRVTAALLERAGWRVEAVADVGSGLEALERPDHGFDVILTDLVLPGMSGRDLLRRASKISSRPTLVAMSGYSAEEADGGGERLPEEVRFLGKPFTPEELLGTLGGALADRRPA